MNAPVSHPRGAPDPAASYDDSQHTRNENLRLGNHRDGIELYAGLLTQLSG
jgi:acetylornithine deacetylase/succinyl-diaminopimelate desuccinylase-like protein